MLFGPVWFVLGCVLFLLSEWLYYQLFFLAGFLLFAWAAIGVAYVVVRLAIAIRSTRRASSLRAAIVSGFLLFLAFFVSGPLSGFGGRKAVELHWKKNRPEYERFVANPPAGQVSGVSESVGRYQIDQGPPLRVWFHRAGSVTLGGACGFVHDRSGNPADLRKTGETEGVHIYNYLAWCRELDPPYYYCCTGSD